jgi:DNA polymerase-3 subunit epsilon
MGWREGPLLGFDLETTGVDTSRDVPVQVALIWTLPHEVLSADSFLVDPGREIPVEAVAIHGISTERARAEGRSLEETAVRLHVAIADAAAAGVPLVAMNANFDVTIAEGLFERFGLPSIEWGALVDPLVLDRHVDRYRKGKRCLDALCTHYRIRLRNAHDAGADAEAAVSLARRIAYRFRECGDLTAAELTLEQAGWHEEWAIRQDEWQRSQGLPGLRPEEFCWPCRRVAGAAGLPATATVTRRLGMSVA